MNIAYIVPCKVSWKIFWINIEISVSWNVKSSAVGCGIRWGVGRESENRHTGKHVVFEQKVIPFGQQQLK